MAHELGGAGELLAVLAVDVGQARPDAGEVVAPPRLRPLGQAGKPGLELLGLAGSLSRSIWASRCVKRSRRRAPGRGKEASSARTCFISSRWRFSRAARASCTPSVPARPRRREKRPSS